MVSYDSMKQQIERETSDYLAKNQNVNVSKPSFSCKKNKVSIEFEVDELLKADVINTMEILGEYYTNFSFPNFKFSRWGGGRYTLVAEQENTLFGTKDKKNQIEISIILNEIISKRDKARSTIRFEKEKEFSQEDINGFLEVWKMYAPKEDCKDEGHIKERLNELGAVVYEASQDCTWNSIAGYERIKQEVKDTIILPFKHPEIYKNVGKLTRTNLKSNVPRAVLFEGPPGTAKTTMARIIANESDIPLIYIPIESIMTCWYGESPKRLGKIFDYSGGFKKSLLFLDEIDSLAGSRENTQMHEETRRVLSVLLRKMQGFVSLENVLTISATNRINDLDHALLSRFNRIITFPLPEPHEREAIFHYYAKHLDPESLKRLSEATDSRSGRDIEDICSDAERVWAGKIISKDVKISPPTLETYLEAIKFKFNKK